MFKQVVFPIRFDRMLIIHFVYVLNFATFVSFFAQKKNSNDNGHECWYNPKTMFSCGFHATTNKKIKTNA